MPVYKSNDPKRANKPYYFLVYYKDPFGDTKRHHSKWFETKKECEQEQAKFITHNKQTKRIKFYDCAMDYFSTNKNEWHVKTYNQKVYFLNRFFKPLEKKYISNITPFDIRKILENKDLEQYSTRYKNKMYDTLSNIFKHGCSFYGLRENPCSNIKRFKMTDKEKLQEMSIWTPEQFKTFYNAIPSEKWIQATCFWVLFNTGMRKNECLSIRFCDYKDQVFNVFQQYQNKKWKPLKTKNSNRKIKVDKATDSLILKLYDYYSSFEGFEDTWFMFGGLRPISASDLDRVKNNAIKETGLPEIRIHDFRHSHASLMIMNGAEMTTVSRRLGHSSISMTIDKYTHLLPDSQDQIEGILNRINSE